MRENCTYGSMRGRAFPTGRPALLYTPLQETVDNYLFRRKDLMAILFSRLIAFVECCVAVPANRIGLKTMTLEQGIRYLSREEKVRHITGRPRKVVKRLIVPKKKRNPERTRPSGISPDPERRLFQGSG